MTETADRMLGQAPAGRRPARPMLVGGAWTIAVLAAFAAYLRLASTRAANSGGAAPALQAWDMVHGNVLLHGWALADVTFYSTEVPQYALVELVHGLNQNVVTIATAMTYTLVLLFVALVAKGTATGWQAVTRAAIGVGIMLAPQLASGTNVLLSSPDHLGTSVPLLLVLLILDRVRQPRWWLPAVVSLLLAWAQLADSVVLVAGVMPLIVVCAPRRYEIALAVGTLVAVGVAQAAYHVIHAVGGYSERPVGPQLAPLSEIF